MLKISIKTSSWPSWLKWPKIWESGNFRKPGEIWWLIIGEKKLLRLGSEDWNISRNVFTEIKDHCVPGWSKFKWINVGKNSSCKQDWDTFLSFPVSLFTKNFALQFPTLVACQIPNLHLDGIRICRSLQFSPAVVFTFLLFCQGFPRIWFMGCNPYDDM